MCDFAERILCVCDECVDIIISDSDCKAQQKKKWEFRGEIFTLVNNKYRSGILPFTL